MITTITSIRNGTSTPRLESTTPAGRTPGVTVELEPGGVSGREEMQLLGYTNSCVAEICTVIL